MSMTPRCVAAYLNASLRNEARDRLTNAMVHGYVHLPPEAQRTILNIWAMQSRGEALTSDKIDEASGVVSVAPADIGTWINDSPIVPARRG